MSLSFLDRVLLLIFEGDLDRDLARPAKDEHWEPG